MTDRLSNLDDIAIASPCPADWEGMTGDDRTRFCAECKLNVYNLSGMTDSEAKDLIANAEGRLCVRLFRRADGTVLTRDCPVGLRAARRAARWAWARCVALVTAVFGPLTSCGEREPEPHMGIVAPPPDEQPLMGEMVMPEDERPVMGKICLPAPDPDKDR